MQFQLVGNHAPDANEKTALESIPTLGAADVIITTDELQTLSDVISTMKNTETVTITRL